MNSNGNDIEQIKELVQQQVREGNTIIAFSDDLDMLNIDGLHFFNNAYDATEFCYENSTDRDHFRMGSSETVLELLAEHEKENKLINQKAIIMNQENFDYLKKQVMFTGFGESLENELKTNMEKQQPNFELHHLHKFGNDNTITTLNFRKSDTQDMYFFNNYHLSLEQPGDKEPLQQTFYVGKDNTFTLKEGYNMLAGRAVNKDLVNREGEGYNSWVQLNFKETDQAGNFKLKHYTENYGYNLQEALSKLPIKELATADDKSRLIESLQKGNRQSVTFLTDGKEEKRFIEANPQFKSITVYDGSMKRIRQDQKEGESTGQSSSQAKKTEQKHKDDDGEGGTKNTEKKTRRKAQGIS